MESNNHKGSEYNNIIETWNQNEKNSENGNAGRTVGNTTDQAATGNDLEQLIKQEASEYDNVNKEERVLGGDRATIKDEPGDNASDE